MKMLIRVIAPFIFFGLSAGLLSAKVVTFFPSNDETNALRFYSKDGLVTISKTYHPGANCPEGGSAIVVEVTAVDKSIKGAASVTPLQIQDVRAGSTLTAEFWLAAPTETQLQNVSGALSPWTRLALEEITVTPTWQKFVLTSKVEQYQALVQPFRIQGLRHLSVGSQIYIGAGKVTITEPQS